MSQFIEDEAIEECENDYLLLKSDSVIDSLNQDSLSTKPKKAIKKEPKEKIIHTIVQCEFPSMDDFSEDVSEENDGVDNSLIDGKAKLVDRISEKDQPKKEIVMSGVEDDTIQVDNIVKSKTNTVIEISEETGVRQKSDICSAAFELKLNHRQKKAYEDLSLKTEAIDGKFNDKTEAIEMDILVAECDIEEKDSDVNREARQTELDLGFLYKTLKVCFPNKTAVTCVIMFTIILNLADAFSDYSLSYLLFKTRFSTAAWMILAIDYGVFFITVSHYLMKNLATEKCYKIITESLFLVILHPIAPALCALSWAIVRTRGLKQGKLHYMTKLTATIQGCAEAPMQIVVTSWLFLTNQLEVPWNNSSSLCDKHGNCLHLGILLPLSSLIMSWLSLTKGSLDAFQSSDLLPTVSLLFPSLLFRLGTIIILVTFTEIWSLASFLILLLVNITISSCYSSKHNQSQQKIYTTGINLFTTILVSLFSFNLLPEDPTSKERTGEADVDPKHFRGIAATMVPAGATIMMISMLVLYCILTFTSFHTNYNIILTKEQFDYTLCYICTPFYFLVLISSIGFYCTYNRPLSMWKKLIVNGIPLVFAIGIIAANTHFFPSGPKSIHIVVETTCFDEMHIKIITGLTQQSFDKDENCTGFTENTQDFINCGDFTLQLRNNFKSIDPNFTMKNTIYTKENLQNIVNTKQITKISIINDLSTLKPQSDHCMICTYADDNFCQRKLHEAIKNNNYEVCSDSYRKAYECTAPDIAYKLISSYDLIWKDTGAIGFESIEYWTKEKVSIWQPRNYQSEFCLLGDVATNGYNSPTDSAIAVRAIKSSSLVHPTSLTQIWNDKGTGADWNCAIYKMNAPKGYTCLGGVAMRSHTLEPEKNKYCCVKNEYLVLGRFEKIYDDKGTEGNEDLSLWTVKREANSYGIQGGNFIPVNGYSMPSSGNLLKVDKAQVMSIHEIQSSKNDTPFK